MYFKYESFCPESVNDRKNRKLGTALSRRLSCLTPGHQTDFLALEALRCYAMPIWGLYECPLLHSYLKKTDPRDSRMGCGLSNKTSVPTERRQYLNGTAPFDNSCTVTRRQFCRVADAPSANLVKVWVKNFRETGTTTNQNRLGQERFVKTPESQNSIVADKCSHGSFLSKMFIDFLHEQCTYNDDFYCEPFRKVKAVFCSKWRRVPICNVLLPHNNARPYTAKLTQQILENIHWESLGHPPYCPDLSPVGLIWISKGSIGRGGILERDRSEGIMTRPNTFYDNDIKKFQVAGNVYNTMEKYCSSNKFI